MVILLNAHNVPTLLCTGKYETLIPDAREALKRAGVVDRVTFPPFQPSKTIDYVRDFYALISQSEISNLQATYGFDFVSFGYKYPYVNDSLIQ